jgi:hypothetical protein
MLKCAEQFKNAIKFNFLSSSHYHAADWYFTVGYIEFYEHRGKRVWWQNLSGNKYGKEDVSVSTDNTVVTLEYLRFYFSINHKFKILIKGL